MEIQYYRQFAARRGWDCTAPVLHAGSNDVTEPNAHRDEFAHLEGEHGGANAVQVLQDGATRWVIAKQDEPAWLASFTEGF